MAEMTTVRLVALDDKFLCRTRLGTIGGTIYFQIGEDQFFPEKGWSDIPLAVLRAWLEALIQIADGTVAESTVPFFDGDLGVGVSASRTGFVQLDFVHREKIQLSTTASVRDLLENALAVADFLLTTCGKKNWSNNDTEALTGLTHRAFRSLSNLRGGAPTN